MNLNKNKRALTALFACVALGTTGGIAGSMAASSGTTAKKSSTTAKTRAAGDKGRRGPGGPGGPGVHSESVVLNKAGTAFITRTEDSGKIKAISGNEVTITEGTETVTYKDVTLTLADGATIRRNGATAKVSDLAVGDRIRVSVSSEGTEVDAHDASHKPEHGPGGRGHGGPPPAKPAS